MFERLELLGANNIPYEIIYHDTKMEYNKTIRGLKVDDITFHYRYEAKCYDYLLKNRSDLIKDTSLFWIVGSVPDLETTALKCNKVIPDRVVLYRDEPESSLENFM